MADKSHHDHSKSNWTDGFPHGFQGWGPQTPDPEHASDEQTFVPDNSLAWTDTGETHGRHVWRFDMRRHHHN